MYYIENKLISFKKKFNGRKIEEVKMMKRYIKKK
jgi:hypothetical protein